MQIYISTVGPQVLLEDPCEWGGGAGGGYGGLGLTKPFRGEDGFLFFFFWGGGFTLRPMLRLMI